MNQANDTPALDLRNVPEPMRSLLLRQLAKLPAPMREKLLREGSPILDRLIAKARAEAGEVAPLPALAAESKPDEDDDDPIGTTQPRRAMSSSGRVPTVMPGDSANHVAWLFGGAIALIGAIWYAAQG